MCVLDEELVAFLEGRGVAEGHVGAFDDDEGHVHVVGKAFYGFICLCAWAEMSEKVVKKRGNV